MEPAAARSVLALGPLQQPSTASTLHAATGHSRVQGRASLPRLHWPLPPDAVAIQSRLRGASMAEMS